MNLRPYQQQAAQAAITWIKKCLEPGVLELPTGSGKSWVIVAIAHWLYEHTGKRVLCLQPSKELTLQNHEKYLATGNDASIFSASAGAKCLRYPVVYGTPGTVKNSIKKFGDEFAMVIVDECHGITPTIQTIIAAIREKNPKLRVLGLSATPYRTMTGYIYAYDLDGRKVPDEQTREPYFNKLLFRLTTRELIDQGYLTEAITDPQQASGYRAGNLQLNSQGKFDQSDLERVFEGRGRLTSQIVADVVSHAQDRRGVMLFASTVAHAKEILESLPPGNSHMLGGDVNMKKAQREQLINDFKGQRFKYLVSVATLTTGFDAPHVDLVAVLRPTESPGLFQQIIGRGLRLYDGKADCLVLDYAENVERHHLEGDLFTPEIRVKGSAESGEEIQVTCPECEFVNEFVQRANPERFEVSKDGYFIDLAGNPIEGDHGPIPAHHGRRCQAQVLSATPGKLELCSYRWTCKECEECGADNDIAARFCSSCRAELVDPNEKLRREFARIKKDPRAVSTDKVLGWSTQKTMTASGHEALLCTFTTKYRTFKMWYNPNIKSTRAVAAWEALSRAVFDGRVAPSVDAFIDNIHKGTAPETITYAQNKNNDFFTIYAYNRPEDVEP